MKRGTGCLLVLTGALAVGGLFALLVKFDPSTRRAVGVRPFVELEWTMPLVDGRMAQITDALGALPSAPGRYAGASAFGDRIFLTVHMPGAVTETDALRAQVESLLSPAWDATFVEAERRDKPPLWVYEVHHAVRRVGRRLENMIGGR